MAVTLSAESKKQALASIKRYCAEALELDLGDLKAGSLLDFFLNEIGPSVYNLALGVMCAGCASAGGPAAFRTPCALLARDSVFAQGAVVYRECAVDRPAQLLTPRAPIDFPAQGSGTCFSARVRFVVDTTGVPDVRTAQVIQSNSFAFGDALITSIRQWRYRPAVLAGRAVRQIVEEGRTVASFVTRAPMGRMPSMPAPPLPC